MIARRAVQAVDSHTEGMPTRVITGGAPRIPGSTMLERKGYFEAHLDDLRLWLMREPHGHGAMSGAILLPPTRPDADWGVLFIEVSGCLPMCGHGTIGVATVLVETGMVPVTEPETLIRLDVPAGLIEARVEVSNGRAAAVTIRNVPSFCARLDAVVDLPRRGQLKYDLGYGGNFYAFVRAGDLGLEATPADASRLVAAGLEMMAAIDEKDEPVHPLSPDVRGVRHVVVHEPGAEGADARSATVIHPGWIDRSPCGTGTSARMAVLHARGELEIGDEFVNESVIGTRFTGRLVAPEKVGDLPAVSPEIRGRAWITGIASYVLADEDPFPTGFAL
jgi:proline racemase